MISNLFNNAGLAALRIAPGVQEAAVAAGVLYGQFALRLVL